MFDVRTCAQADGPIGTRVRPAAPAGAGATARWGTLVSSFANSRAERRSSSMICQELGIGRRDSCEGPEKANAKRRPHAPLGRSSRSVGGGTTGCSDPAKERNLTVAGKLDVAWDAPALSSSCAAPGPRPTRACAPVSPDSDAWTPWTDWRAPCGGAREALTGRVRECVDVGKATWAADCGSARIPMSASGLSFERRCGLSRRESYTIPVLPQTANDRTRSPLSAPAGLGSAALEHLHQPVPEASRRSPNAIESVYSGWAIQLMAVMLAREAAALTTNAQPNITPGTRLLSSIIRSATAFRRSASSGGCCRSTCRRVGPGL